MLADQVPYYILDLLQQSPSVQVPGLGRFDAIFHPAVVDIPGARVSPPYIEPGFHGQEGPADAFLQSYICYVSGYDTATVSQAIEDFVKKVMTITTEEQSYSIDTFGTFSRSPAGHLRFTPDWDAFNLSFSGLEILDVKEPIQKSPPPPGIVTPIAPPVKIPDTSTSLPEEMVPVSRQEEETPEILSPVRPGIIPVSNELPDENTSKLWWMILISAIVLITILCAYLAWDIISNRHRLNDLRQVSPDTMGITHVVVPPVVSDTAQGTQQDQPSTPSDMETPVAPVDEPTGLPQGQDCYVIVGAFGDPANVTRMMERLTSMGYTAEEIKGASLTKVAIRTSCDPDQLQKVLNEARSSINPEAWIY